MSPELKKVDLSKADKHNHPDIRTYSTSYLCKIDGEWFAGKFDQQHFGLNFNGWFSPLQFDKPGTNHSMWEEIYEIKDKQEK